MRMGRRLAFATIGVLAGLAATPARAGSAWDDIRASLFAGRAIEDGKDVLAFSAPYRALEQRAVPISVDAAFSDGRGIKTVTFVVDENPMPVAAVFHLAGERDRLRLGANLRLDQASPVRVVVEANDGRLYMTETFVKASGLGVCAAPPLSDQNAVLGEMKLTDLTGSDAAAGMTRFRRSAQIDITHPQNTGMQMNQITMLYIPLRFISAVEVRQGEQKLFDLEGSMSLSENPRIWFDYRINGAGHIGVTARDTNNTAWEQQFPIGSGS